MDNISITDDTIKNTIKLMACAVNNGLKDVFSEEDLRQIDYAQLFEFCNFQSIVGTIAVGIDKAAKYCGVDPSCLNGHEAFTDERMKNIYRQSQFNYERAAILAEMDAAGILYMPLKGVILKDVYPQVGMRSMADNDILFDSQRADEVRSIFENCGYTVESFGEGHHDTYLKKPMFNFEMHTFLGEDGLDCDSYNDYYRDPKRLMIKDEGNSSGYHMSDENFYIYMIAHAFKHYNYAGTGLRIIVDTYVYINRYGFKLNWSYIKAECEKIGMVEFERNVRSLADKLLGTASFDDLTSSEIAMLNVMTASATYGTDEVKHRLQVMKSQKSTGAFDATFDFNEHPTRLGKAKYLWHRAFPNQKHLMETYPMARHKWAIPFVHIYRAFKRCNRLFKNSYPNG